MYLIIQTVSHVVSLPLVKYVVIGCSSTGWEYVWEHPYWATSIPAWCLDLWRVISHTRLRNIQRKPHVLARRLGSSCCHAILLCPTLCCSYLKTFLICTSNISCADMHFDTAAVWLTHWLTPFIMCRRFCLAAKCEVHNGIVQNSWFERCTWTELVLVRRGILLWLALYPWLHQRHRKGRHMKASIQLWASPPKVWTIYFHHNALIISSISCPWCKCTAC